MAVDISKVGNVVEITDNAAQPVAYYGGAANYSFNAAGTILNVNFGGTNQVSIDFDDLTIGGVAPADVAAAYTALSTVFPSEGGGSGTTPTLDEVLVQGNNAGGTALLNVGGVSLSQDGGVLFKDTVVPANTYILTVASGVLVLTLQGE